MIASLKINNLALITESNISFESGFNTLTGETGAGKSIIIDSLNFVLGGKADKNLIKTGTDFVKVQAVFNLSSVSKDIADFFDSINAESDTTIIISRLFNLAGKNEIRVNGEAVTATMLKKLSSSLVNIHGQHDNQSVLESKNHIKVLDQLSLNVFKLKQDLNVKLDILKEYNNQIDALGGEGENKQNLIILLNHQISEIEMADLKEGEEEELVNKRNYLKNSEKLAKNLSEAVNYLNADGGVVSSLKNANYNLQTVESISEELKALKDRLTTTLYEANDISDTLASLLGSIEYDEDTANSIEERLDLIKELKRKYGKEVSDVLTFLENARTKLYALENSEQELKKINDKKQVVLQEIFGICVDLTSERKYISEQFEKNIVTELADLGIKNAQFKVSFNNGYTLDNIEDCVSKNGADNLEFLFSANAGMELRPLTKIISGGELSRFMLAFKCVTRDGNNQKTLIFDEIDAGIGGRIGLEVGKKISNIAKNNQVICVTHLAQIASFADYNFKIEKTSNNQVTQSNIHLLSSDQKVKEISRMLGLAEGSTSGELSANELINYANTYKLG